MEASHSCARRPTLLVAKRVLVAEDDPGARRLVAAVLRAMGLDVIETDDGGRMLVAVAAHYKGGLTPADLDLIVAGAHMPVLEGLEVCRGLRAAHWTTPIIVVTRLDAPDIREAVERLGAVLLPKPLDRALLTSTVRDILFPRPP